MGAPFSSTLSEIFLQPIERLHIKHLGQKHKIKNYVWYVADILLIFDVNHTNIQAILEDINTLHLNVHFTADIEQNNVINYLDIFIHKTHSNIKMSIYRKPTFTDTIIPYSSNHPTQQKYAAVIFLYNRLNTYQLHNKEYSQEENTIHNILYNSSFPIWPQKPIIPLLNQRQSSPNPTHKWTVFTYIGRENTYISNIFKHSDIKIAYHTNTYIDSHLINKVYNHDIYLSTGVYKLTCPDCNRAYIGQTGKTTSKDTMNTNVLSVTTVNHLDWHKI